jgi:hypothetical protein
VDISVGEKGGIIISLGSCRNLFISVTVLCVIVPCSVMLCYDSEILSDLYKLSVVHYESKLLDLETVDTLTKL